LRPTSGDAADTKQPTVTRVVLQSLRELDLDRVDLVGKHHQHLPLRSQPGRVGAGQVQRDELLGRQITVEVPRGESDVALGQQRADSGLHRRG
jgi:hypothetical protein